MAKISRNISVLETQPLTECLVELFDKRIDYWFKTERIGNGTRHQEDRAGQPNGADSAAARRQPLESAGRRRVPLHQQPSLRVAKDSKEDILQPRCPICMVVHNGHTQWEYGGWSANRNTGTYCPLAHPPTWSMPRRGLLFLLKHMWYAWTLTYMVVRELVKQHKLEPG